jgi:hypothetical protein
MWVFSPTRRRLSANELRHSPKGTPLSKPCVRRDGAPDDIAIDDLVVFR